MKGDNISAVYWARQCHRGKGRIAGGRIDEADGGVGVSEQVMLPTDECKGNNEFADRWSKEVRS